MEKIKYIFLVVVLSLLTSVSCDVLDEEIISGVTVDTHYGTPDGFVDAVNASYEKLRDFYGDEDGCEITVFGTDEYTNGGHGGAQGINKYNSSLNAESETFWDPWQRFYEGINCCNAVIGRAPEADIPDAEKAVMVGEVKFLRAHYYYLLVEFWGPVHLTLEETTGVETEATRTPEPDIYDAIISDLNDAIAVLPVTQAEFGRITKTAAQHHLALIYLTRAYKSWGDGVSDFNMAAQIADDVINNSGRVLLDDYQRNYNDDDGSGGLVHTTATEQNDEIIFSVQYDIDPLLNDEGNRTHVYFRAWYETFNNGLNRALGHGYGRPWIRFRPTPWLLENFRPLDVDSRYVKSFADVWYYNNLSDIPAGANLGDTAIVVTHMSAAQLDTGAMKARLAGVNIFTWNLDEWDEDWCLWRTDVSVNSPNINIFPVPWKIDDNLRSSLNATNGSRDVPVFRLGETYLIAAEAYVGAGDNATAADRLNVIRRRAAFDGMEAQMEITAGEVDLDFVLDEWSREVFGEQQRWLDLKRTGKLVERVRLHNHYAAPNIQDFHVLRPIPAHQLTRMTTTWEQNPGY